MAFSVNSPSFGGIQSSYNPAFNYGGGGSVGSPFPTFQQNPFNMQQMIAQLLQAITQLSSQWGGLAGANPGAYGQTGNVGSAGGYGGAGHAPGGAYGGGGGGGYQPAPQYNAAVAVNVQRPAPPPAPKGGGAGAYG
jgi:hypothetical protein